jgi:hypothetical protein
VFSSLESPISVGRRLTLLKMNHLCVNRLLLPAIRHSYPSNVVQYHPRSFEDVESKTYIRRRENYSGMVRSDMDMHYHLPKYLEKI